jgi:hypothetical protein
VKYLGVPSSRMCAATCMGLTLRSSSLKKDACELLQAILGCSAARAVCPAPAPAVRVECTPARPFARTGRD